MVRAFCDELEKAGYWAGLYTSHYILSTHVEDDIKTRYALWIAEWGDKLNYSGSVDIWQHSCKGVVNGISGDVDLDIAYVDYPTKIKAAGLNGYKDVKPTHDVSKDNAVTVSVQIGGDRYKGTLTRE